MSAWQIAVRSLHAAGGAADIHTIASYHLTPAEAGNAMRHAIAYGVAIGPGQGRTAYELTQLGRDFCEGRVIAVRGRYGVRGWTTTRPSGTRRAPATTACGLKTRFVATWLASLPRGITLRSQA